MFMGGRIREVAYSGQRSWAWDLSMSRNFCILLIIIVSKLKTFLGGEKKAAPTIPDYIPSPLKLEVRYTQERVLGIKHGCPRHSVDSRSILGIKSTTSL